MGLRSLTFDIKHQINSSPIVKADNLTNKYKKRIIETSKATDKWTQKNNKVNSSIKKIGGSIATFLSFAAAKRGIETVITRTAQLEEQTSKFETVFGSLTQEANKWSRQYSDVVGRSVVETRKFLAESQNMLVGFGATRKEGFELSKQIQTLAVDLASFNNVADSDSLSRLQSGLLGNHEAVRNLGIVLTENTLNLKAQELGFKRNFKELDPLTKIQVRYAVAVSQSQDAIGDAAKTSGSFTNQLKRLQGRFFDLTSEGGSLIESMQRLVAVTNNNFDTITKFVKGGINVAAVAIEKFAGLVEFTIENGNILIPVIAGLTTGFATLKIVGVVSGLMATYNTITGVTTTVQGAANVQLGIFNTLLAANPIGAVIIAIGSLVTLIVLLAKNWDRLTEIVKGFISKIKDFFTNIKPPKWLSNLFGKKTEISFRDESGPLGTAGTRQTNIDQLTVPAFQRGTSFAPGGISLIDESPGGRGEVLDLPQGTRVYPEARTTGLRQQSALPPVTINIYPGENQNARTIAREVKRELEKMWRNIATAEGQVIRSGSV